MPKLVSVNEAVQRSGFTRQTIYNLIRAGKVKFVRHGGWLYEVDWPSLAAYCAQRNKKLGETQTRSVA